MESGHLKNLPGIPAGFLISVISAMRKRIPIHQLLFVLVLCNSPIYAQRPDTLYFNANWQICEKPFASYYRFGKIVTDNMWYYEGRVVDHYINDTLQMEGHYADSGAKQGIFRFYYLNGNLSAAGMFAANKQAGTWEYYYSNGLLKLKLDYAGDGKNYKVLEYRDSTGTELLKDGSGQFQMPVSFMNGAAIYTLTGHLKNGKKDGLWEYRDFHPLRQEWVTVISEEYKNDRLQEGTIYRVYPTTSVSSRYNTPNERIGLPEFEKFRLTEAFAKDPTTFKNSQFDNDLLEYLETGKPPTYQYDTASYAESMVSVLTKLNASSITGFFSTPGKIYGGEIVFTLTDSSLIKEVEVYGNLDPKEKEQMIFFIRRFKKIQDITPETDELNEEHKIYFFTLFIADFVPAWYRSYFPKEIFFFSPWPYRATIDRLKAKRKKTKKS